jgi:hypothetical protein
LSKPPPAVAALENLAKIGKLKREPPAANEIAGLIASGTKRLRDAANRTLSFESRFDLAYNAAHALALAALRSAGYRSENRYLVFQSLPHTVGLPTAHWRVLAKAHEVRNLAELTWLTTLLTHWRFRHCAVQAIARKVAIWCFRRCRIRLGCQRRIGGYWQKRTRCEIWLSTRARSMKMKH